MDDLVFRRVPEKYPDNALRYWEVASIRRNDMPGLEKQGIGTRPEIVSSPRDAARSLDDSLAPRPNAAVSRRAHSAHANREFDERRSRGRGKASQYVSKREVREHVNQGTKQISSRGELHADRLENDNSRRPWSRAQIRSLPGHRGIQPPNKKHPTNLQNFINQSTHSFQHQNGSYCMGREKSMEEAPHHINQQIYAYASPSACMMCQGNKMFHEHCSQEESDFKLKEDENRHFFRPHYSYPRQPSPHDPKPKPKPKPTAKLNPSSNPIINPDPHPIPKARPKTIPKANPKTNRNANLNDVENLGDMMHLKDLGGLGDLRNMRTLREPGDLGDLRDLRDLRETDRKAPRTAIPTPTPWSRRFGRKRLMVNRAEKKKRQWCPYCYKKSKVVGDLKKHIRLHTGDKPVCGHCFCQASNRIRHTATQHNQNHAQAKLSASLKRKDVCDGGLSAETSLKHPRLSRPTNPNPKVDSKE
ncbi:hypothetical protein AAMO2058_000282400 [Amorphochlora amoebiformis]